MCSTTATTTTNNYKINEFYSIKLKSATSISDRLYYQLNEILFRQIVDMYVNFSFTLSNVIIIYVCFSYIKTKRLDNEFLTCLLFVINSILFMVSYFFFVFGY